MFITDADRAGALSTAKARTERQYRGTGIYRVTVGGYVVGQVERFALATSKTAVWWSATDDNGVRIGGVHNTRADAVEALAKTDGAAEAYRNAARDGAQGFAESRRVHLEDAARRDELEAIEDDIAGPVLETVEPGKYRTADGRFTVTRAAGPDLYRIDDARDSSRTRYACSIADARPIIGLILGVEAENAARLAEGPEPIPLSTRVKHIAEPMHGTVTEPYRYEYADADPGRPTTFVHWDNGYRCHEFTEDLRKV
jgi:hypothetical protein